MSSHISFFPFKGSKTTCSQQPTELQAVDLEGQSHLKSGIATKIWVGDEIQFDTDDGVTPIATKGEVRVETKIDRKESRD